MRVNTGREMQVGAHLGIGAPACMGAKARRPSPVRVLRIVESNPVV